MYNAITNIERLFELMNRCRLLFVKYLDYSGYYRYLFLFFSGNQYQVGKTFSKGFMS